MDVSRLPPLWRPLGPATEAALFHELPGAPAPPTSPDAWASDVQAILGNRLGGLALASAGSANVALRDDVEAALKRVQAVRVAHCLRLEAAAPEVADALARDGIASVFTKGPGLAHMYPKPYLRTYTDLDVVVPPSRYMDAMDVLRRTGFTESDSPPPRRYFYNYCREATAFGRDVVSVDLHHHIPPWIFGAGLTFARLRGASTELKLESGGTIRVPSVEHQAIVALLHVFSHLGRPGEEPIVWRDILTAFFASDRSTLYAELARMKLGGLARYVFENLPLAVRPPASASLPRELDPMLAYRLRALMPPHLGARHIAGMLYRLPPSHVPAFVGGYLVPARSFLRTHLSDAPRPRLLAWWRSASQDLRKAKDEYRASEPVPDDVP